MGISRKSACYRPKSNETTEAAAVCNVCSYSDYVTAVATNPFASLDSWIVNQEHNFLQSCESSKHKRRIERQNQNLDIPEYCFHAGMVKTPNAVSRFYRCKDKSQVDPIVDDSDYRPCFTPDYVKMTANAFNDMADCFSLSKKEKKEAFAKFNHESAFNLNARSKGRAKCYGQVIPKRFKDLNKYIYFHKEGSHDAWKDWRMYHGIFNEALKRCPYLKNLVIPEELLSDEEASHGKLDQHHEAPPLTCSLTLDPHTCFFYSMYNTKILQTRFYDFYGDGPFFNKGDSSSSNKNDKIIIKDCQPRIERNEMLTVQGTVTTRTGEKKEARWTFWSTKEFHDAFEDSEISCDDVVNDSEIKKVKVPLFNPEELRAYLVHTAYNGGERIIEDGLLEFMEDLKVLITNEAKCNKDRDCKNYREKIFNFEKNAENPSALSLEDLKKEFKKFGASRDPVDGKIRVKEQARNFVDKIETHLHDLMSDLQTRFDLEKDNIDPNECSFLPPSNTEAIQ